jgi:IPT/TIG domain-containing protein
MTKRTRAGIILSMVCLGAVGCGERGSPTAPSAPLALVQQPSPQPTGIQPNLTAVTPNVSSTRGGAWGIITGTDFQSGVTLKLGDTNAAAVAHGGATIYFWGTAPHPAGTVDVVVTNPGGLFTTLTGAYTFAPPESFDFNGEWVAHAGPEYETDMRFTIRNDRLVSVSCDGSAPITVMPAPSVSDGAFSFSGGDGIAISGTLVSPFTAAGTIDVAGTPACSASRWWADKGGAAAGSQYAHTRR